MKLKPYNKLARPKIGLTTLFGSQWGLKIINIQIFCFLPKETGKTKIVHLKQSLSIESFLCKQQLEMKKPRVH